MSHAIPMDRKIELVKGSRKEIIKHCRGGGGGGVNNYTCGSFIESFKSSLLENNSPL